MKFLAVARWALALACSTSILCLPQAQLLADEIRIVDARGLVRAVKISRGGVRVVIILESADKHTPSGVCVATNVDGLSGEKRASVSSKGECVFSDVGGGSWQLAVPEGFSWRVQVYE